MVQSCAVPGCPSSSKGEKRSFFSAPADNEKRKQWADLIGIHCLRYSHRVCERHFDDDNIIRSYIARDKNGKILMERRFEKSRLKKDALPMPSKNDSRSLLKEGQKPSPSQDEHSYSSINCSTPLSNNDHSYAAMKYPARKRCALETKPSNEKVESVLQAENNTHGNTTEGSSTFPQISHDNFETTDGCQFGLHSSHGNVDIHEDTESGAEMIPAELSKDDDQWYGRNAKVSLNANQGRQEDSFQCKPSNTRVFQSSVTLLSDTEKSITNSDCLSSIGHSNIGTHQNETDANCTVIKCEVSEGSTDFTHSRIERENYPDSTDSTLEGHNISTEPANSSTTQRTNVDCSSTNDDNVTYMTITLETFTHCIRKLSTDPVQGNEVSLTIPKPWSAGKLGAADLIFSYHVKIIDNGVKRYVVEKDLIVKASREIVYQVHSKPTDISHSKLPKYLESVSYLPEILKKFKNIRVCTGIKLSDPDYSSRGNVAKCEVAGQWRHTNCAGLVRGARSLRCTVCSKYSNTLYVNMKRNSARKDFSRIHSSNSNFLDQVKIKALKTKVKSQQMKNKRLEKKSPSSLNHWKNTKQRGQRE